MEIDLEGQQAARLLLMTPERTAASVGQFAAAMSSHGARPEQVEGVLIERVLTDHGASYRSKLFARTCHELGLKHLFTSPIVPHTNGKAERLIQMATLEWACAGAYDSSAQRAFFLPSYLHVYNYHRPHSALGHQPPASRPPKTADILLTYNS